MDYQLLSGISLLLSFAEIHIFTTNCVSVMTIFIEWSSCVVTFYWMKCPVSFDTKK